MALFARFGSSPAGLYGKGVNPSKGHTVDRFTLLGGEIF